jgi:hypothetical protein
LLVCSRERERARVRERERDIEREREREFEGSLAFCFRQEITRRRATCSDVHKVLRNHTQWFRV